nr:MAG TPA: hypothetical protein [Caudoviricetes sp.]
MSRFTSPRRVIFKNKSRCFQFELFLAEQVKMGVNNGIGYNFGDSKIF